MAEKRPVLACFGCKRYPLLRIRHLQFDNGVLSVYSVSDAELVRDVDDFGVFVVELEVGEAHKVQPEKPPSEGVARQGMRSAGDPRELPQEQDTPDPETDSPKERFVEMSVPVPDEVIVKQGGWYEYQGKNYRKAALPAKVQLLV